MSQASRIRRSLWLALTLAALTSAGCATGGAREAESATPAPPAAEMKSEAVASPPADPWQPPSPANGFSGMALLSDDTYLVVHDTKADKKGARFGLLKVMHEDGVRYRELDIADWPEGGPANDLESVCGLEGRSGEALVAESGYVQGKDGVNRFGRIFHVRLDGDKLAFLGVYPLPLLVVSRPKIDGAAAVAGDNYEGISCPRRLAGGYWVILGERGASAAYQNGWLRWGILDLDAKNLAYTDAGKAGLEIPPPEGWPPGTKPRAISDLHMDAEGILWTAATADAGDDGPYRSLVFHAAKVTGLERPVEPFTDRKPWWIVDGLKIEALGPAPRHEGQGHTAGPSLVFATEDEHLGGVWRPLYPPSQQ